MSIWILSRTAPSLSDWCVPWNAFLSPKLVGVWASQAHSSWVQLFSKNPAEGQEGTRAAQWCSKAGARPCYWELLQHCPLLTAPLAAALLNKVLTRWNQGKISTTFSQSCTFRFYEWCYWETTQKPWCWEAQGFFPGGDRSSLAEQAQQLLQDANKLMFHEKRRLETLRTSSVKITRFSSSGGCSASLKQTQDLSDASPHFPGAIKAHAES